MTIIHPEVKKKIEEWQNELREITGNEALIVLAYYPPSLHVEMDVLTRVICEETDVPVRLVLKKTRDPKVVLTRHLIAYYASQITGMSLVAIGEQLGDRDHSTVIHARDRIRGLIETGDWKVCEAMVKINKRLQAIKDV